MTLHEIRAVKRKHLDVSAYHNCVNQSTNRSSIYAQAWYLDAVCDEWYVLVAGDYDIVMPISIRRKFGISYVFQPPLVQQLGVFPSGDHDRLFFKTAISRHIHFDYTFYSVSNPIETSASKVNLTLPIAPGFDQILAASSSNRRRDYNKAEQNGMSLRAIDSWNDMAVLIEPQLTGPYDGTLPILERLINVTKETGQIGGVGAYHQDKCVFFLLFGICQDRLYYLLPLSLSEEAKSMGAATWTIFQMMMKYQGKCSILDFEGSSLPGVRRFYESFGATQEPYYHVKKSLLQFIKHAR